MKDIILYIPIILITSLGFLYSQVPDTLWTKTYGGADNDRGYSVKQTNDGGFIIGGETNSFGADHGYLIKTDEYGDTIWTRTYSGPITSVLQTYDGGYIFTGTVGRHIYIVRTDSFGDTLWTRVIVPSNNHSRAEEIQPTSNSCYIIVGTATDSMTYEYFDETYLLKIDDDGDTLWTKKYGQWSCYGQSVQQTVDNGYIVAGRWLGSIYLMKTNPLGDSLWLKHLGGGHTNSVRQILDGGYIIAGCYNNENYTFEHHGTNYPEVGGDVYLIKTDRFGNSEWTRVFDTGMWERGYSVKQTTNGGYIVAGRAYLSSFGARVYVIRTDESGDTIWTKMYRTDYNNSGQSIQQTYDNGFIITGTLDNDFCFMKLDSLGNIVWTKTYGGTPLDIGYSVIQTSDNGYTAVGETFTPDSGHTSDVWLLKIAPDTFAVEEAKGKITTNHASGASIIKGPLVLPEGTNCRVFDITGRVVVPQYIKPGVYFIEVDGAITKKIVKVR
ncbi:MAG: PQQ-binding-like beta-propeller repeat protein [bacterium]